jgi:hypothetical protein
MLTRLTYVLVTLTLAAGLPLAANAQSLGDTTPTYSSTLEEGMAHGYADVVRAYGMTTLLDAQAVNQLALARRQAIENQMRAAQVYVDGNRYMQEFRRSQRPAPLSLEQYVRLARDAAPEPLTATQLDQLTGMITWPAPLRKPEYETLRRHIDRLFQERATGYAVYGEIPAACEQFAEKLRADIMQFPAGDYVAAKKFLESLAWSARGVQS